MTLNKGPLLSRPPRQVTGLNGTQHVTVRRGVTTIVPFVPLLSHGAQCQVPSNDGYPHSRLLKLEVVMHSYYLSNLEAETGRSPKFEASLSYMVSSRPARTHSKN